LPQNNSPMKAPSFEFIIAPVFETAAHVLNRRPLNSGPSGGTKSFHLVHLARKSESELTKLRWTWLWRCKAQYNVNYAKWGFQKWQVWKESILRLKLFELAQQFFLGVLGLVENVLEECHLRIWKSRAVYIVINTCVIVTLLNFWKVDYEIMIDIEPSNTSGFVVIVECDLVSLIGDR
jgi:hypothetical protein